LIRIPTKCHRNTERETTTLYFGNATPIEYDIRGGICWPISFEVAPGQFQVQGYAVLCGYNVKTGALVVLSQQEWVVVNNVVDSSGIVTHEGLGNWFNRCWSKYFGQKFYYHQPPHLRQRLKLEINRSEPIQPKPIFKEIDWSHDVEAIHTVWRLAAENKLAWDKDSPLHQDMQRLSYADTKTITASIHALVCAVMGFERFPWRNDVP
jgi:hypothetical protein